ncbi:stage V sporulation protein K [Ammoniphilus oxalaticus]|uniref:Stage V sporulation protein K n=1 Tax=Ammoniphilus oxalaticus TaxID=66863 RepID=A0A419SQJ6_9BACL|nr:stage V sporulation protein K [Ammoniphilus oxalaticus]RKD26721.1 stage V sporulation protein K [Ammoniphilus oxalaticus]
MTWRATTTQAPNRINVVINQQTKNTKSLTESFSKISNDSGAVPHERFLQITKELDRLIGMKSIKDLIYEIYALLYINQCRRKEGLKTDGQVLHMIFKGNPGTGKTTVARIVGKLFREMGVLSKGHLVEVERADLVGEYIGHTAQKTREHIKKAMGGILFIDEAYSLARGGDKDFGREAIDCLVKGLEDHRNDFILILAGYSEEMDDFLSSNPGLPSRFPIQVDFPDYLLDELMQIAEMMVEEREYQFSSYARQKLRKHLQTKLSHSSRSFSNARHVRNLIEKSIRFQAVRLMQKQTPSKEDLITIGSDDLRCDSQHTRW